MTWFTNLHSTLRIYLVPGLIFQSVIVGGGYGTGREIAEFFMVHGAWGGLLGMVVSCVVWGVVLAVAFEFARITRSYDYQSFFRALLGRYWWLFEVIFLLIALLVLAVLGSASGEMVAQSLGWPPLAGTAVMITLVVVLSFFGSDLIERVFVGWSALLYATYVAVMLMVFHRFGSDIFATLQQSHAVGNWGFDGIRYAAYNLNALAAVLFVVPRFTRTRHATLAGAIAGVVAIVPAVLVMFILLSQYPQSVSAAVPVMDVLLAVNTLWLTVIFQIMLFGTFIETGTGMIHAVNERVANTLRRKKRPFPNWARASIALGALVMTIILADGVGIIALIARGYGWLSYGYLAVVILPLMTLGVWRVVKTRQHAS